MWPGSNQKESTVIITGHSIATTLMANLVATNKKPRPQI
jgi:hypothetical protein